MVWLCEKCHNFVDMEDHIIREQTDEEKDEPEEES